MFSEVSAEEIALAMALFVDAGSRSAIRSGSRVSQAHIEGEQLLFALSFGLHEPFDEEKQAALLQTHLSRAFFRIWEHYEGDTLRSSICARIVGFCYLMEKTRGALVAPWIEQNSSDPEHVQLPSVIILALATVTLTHRGALSEGALVARIESLTGTMAPEVDAEVSVAAWPTGKSEIARLIRERDWSSTSAGPVDQWPASLRMTVDLVLACAFPMIVLWGPDLLQFYNDAYRDIMGAKHPGGVGQPTRDCWPEVWSINQPIYARVQSGETLTFENQLFPIIRYGFLEEAYFTLCYSPVKSEASSIEGVLVTVFETTARVKAGIGQQRNANDSGDNRGPFSYCASI